MNVPTLKSGQMITLAYFIGILIVLYIVYKLLGKVGIIKTAAKRKEEKAEVIAETELRTSEYFDPMFLKDRDGYSPLKSLAAKYATDLRDALRGMGTNEEKIFTTFGKLTSKWNISEVALNYQVKYERDLLTDLLNDLTEAEQLTLFNIIDKLPVR